MNEGCGGRWVKSVNAMDSTETRIFDTLCMYSKALTESTTSKRAFIH